MAINNTRIGTGTVTQVFSATAQTVITTLFFCNTTDNVDTTLDVYITPSGSTATAITQIIKNMPLPAGETFVFDTEKLIFENNDRIFARAGDADTISATVSSMITDETSQAPAPPQPPVVTPQMTFTTATNSQYITVLAY